MSFAVGYEEVIATLQGCDCALVGPDEHGLANVTLFDVGDGYYLCDDHALGYAHPIDATVPMSPGPHLGEWSVKSPASTIFTLHYNSVRRWQLIATPDSDTARRNLSKRGQQRRFGTCSPAGLELP